MYTNIFNRAHLFSKVSRFWEQEIVNFVICSHFSSSSSTTSTSSSSSSLLVTSQEHISHLILNQKSPSQALHTFQWASTLPNFTHSLATYSALIHKLCNVRWFDAVDQLLDEMPASIGAPPDDAIFITIIRGLGRAGLLGRVVKVLDLASKFHDNPPSLKLFNCVLNVLVKHDIDLARRFFRNKMMKCGVQGDDYTYGILMKGLCLTNRIGDGFKLLQIIKSTGANPNSVVYNTLLHALCKKGKVARARSLMNQIEEPNDVTFNLLISAYCKEDDLVQALVLLEKCFSLGFIPDIVSVTKVVQLLCNRTRVTEAAEVLERFEIKGGVIDLVACNTLIKGLCGSGKVKAARGYLKKMELKGCLPNVESYNLLISGFCKCGMLDSALDMFEEMKAVGIDWSLDTFEELIKGMFSSGRIEAGFEILQLMEESKGGSKGRISPYNNVLYGFYRKQMWGEALEFLVKMEKLFPRAVDKSLRILGYCEKGAVEEANKVYEEMVDEGGKPSALVYDCLIHGFCEQGIVEKAFEIMNTMLGNGYCPDKSAFNAVIREMCIQGKEDSAVKLVEDIAGTGRGCLANAGSYNPIIYVLCGKERYGKAASVFTQMVESEIDPDWQSMLLSLSRDEVWVRNHSIEVNNVVDGIINSTT
ncbi:Pentatricopeptide repeat-containing protein At2g17525, mitochondrial [Linum perenne]